MNPRHKKTSDFALEVQNASFHWPKQDGLLFKNINLSLRPGEICAILGPNGAGKTTFLRCLMGLLPWESGATRLFGCPFASLSAKQIWRKLSYVPQAKHIQLAYTVEQMVLLGRAAHLGTFAKPGRADRELARNIIGLLGIEKLRDKLCTGISGGELQMVLIARALCAEPSVMILDEPESNLDYKNQQIILRTLYRLSRDKGIAILFNTHYPEHALRLADKTLLLHEGRGDVGPAGELLTSDRLSELFSIPIAVHRTVIEQVTYPIVIPLLQEEDQTDFKTDT